MPAPYILAKDLRQAHNFARETLGLERGRYRIVHSSSSISSVRGTDLYLVPGWEGRFDRFAIKGALRYTRLNVIDGAEVAPSEPVGEPDGLVPAGEQLVLVPQGEVHDFFVADLRAELVEAAKEVVKTFEDEIISAAKTDPEPEVAEEPKKNRRRSRCKDCGTLHFKGEACAEQPLIED